MEYKPVRVSEDVHERLLITKYRYKKKSISELLSDMLEVYEKYKNEKK